jgi:flagellin
MGPMALQIGANEGQQMNVKIPACDAESLYVDDVDVTTVLGAERAIAQCDAAIASINKVRSSLGAYTNRLDSATKSLDETSENMNSAISRISDVDMALEMTEYTRLNVLSQTATSALSQANELPQLALQLLG